jgi:hypothetical protein
MVTDSRAPIWARSITYVLLSNTTKCLLTRLLCLVCLSIYLSICLWFYSPLLDLGSFFIFLSLYTVGRTPLTGDQPVVRPLPLHRTTQTQNKRSEISMSWVGFEPTISAFERPKTVYVLDRAATVIGFMSCLTRGKCEACNFTYKPSIRGANLFALRWLMWCSWALYLRARLAPSSSHP